MAPAEAPSEPSRASTLEAVTAGVLVIIGLGSLWLPWIRVQVASDGGVLRGVDLHKLAVGVVALLVATAGCAAFRWRTGRAAPLSVAFACLGWASALVVLAIEASAAAIPSGLVPKTVRRQFFDVSAGSGAWVALGVGLLGLVLTAAPQVAYERGAGLVRRRWSELAGASLGVVALVLLANGRYQTWFELDGGGRSGTVALWQLPWAGPWTMAALWIGATAIAIGFLTSRALPLLVGSAVAFGLAMLGAAAVATPRTLGRARVGEVLVRYLPSASQTPLGDVTLHVQAGPGPATVCAAGLLLAVASSLLLKGGGAT